MALHVISGAAYGRPFDWEASDKVSPGHKLSYLDSLRQVINDLLILFILPRRMLQLPINRLQVTETAYTEFGRYLQELVELEKNRGEATSLNSVLKSLVDHSAQNTSESVKEQRVFNDEELIGNAFVILLGGHDSTYIPQKNVCH